ncbi:MAG: helix-turn-helix transcriptional regulator [Anaerolineales bacterium]|nr:helix-turn-helix transcriptional regulator [Anaerolineales bacterium]
MDVLKQFGETIRKIRLERGLSQEQLALLAGVHRTYVGAVERGERNITLKNIEKLAKTLNVPIGEIFRNI